MSLFVDLDVVCAGLLTLTDDSAPEVVWARAGAAAARRTRTEVAKRMRILQKTQYTQAALPI